MTKIKNDIKVLYRKAFKEVEVSTFAGEMYLFNNNNLLDKNSLYLLSDYIFTGIAIEDLNTQVALHIMNINNDPVEYVLHKNFICVKYINTDFNLPVAVLSFVPKTTHWAGGSFYAHFIELDSGGYYESI